MSVNVGRKTLVPVLMTEKLVDKIDAIATREAETGAKPNRSRVIRRFVSEGIERDEQREGGE